jgi:acyl carrier protein
MTTAVLAIVVDRLRAMRPECSGLESLETAQSRTLGSLELDSLDTLQLAMELETALGVEIEVGEFHKGLTLSQLAEKLAAIAA